MNFFRDIGGEFDDLVRFSFRIENGIVAGLDIDFFSTFANTLVFAWAKLAPIEFPPEFPVLIASSVRILTEGPVVSANRFVECITQNVEKVIVGSDDSAIQIKFYDSLWLTNCIHFALKISIS